MRSNISFAVLAVLTTAVVAVAVPARANSGGAPAVCTNEPGEKCGTTQNYCIRCHTLHTPAPEVTVDHLTDQLDVGGSVTFTIHIHTTDTTGGIGTVCAAGGTS